MNVRETYSRIGFVHEFRPLSVDELTFVVHNHWTSLGLTLNPSDYTDAEAFATITREVVETARESLVIGVL